MNITHEKPNTINSIHANNTKEHTMNATKDISSLDVISSGLGAELLYIAWTLADYPHAVNKQLEEDVVLFEFADAESCEDFTQAAVDYINRCTEHEADLAYQPCTAKSNSWQRDSISVYLPTIEIRFDGEGLQVEGQLLSDDNGKPYGVLVIDCDKKDAKLLETVIRF